MGIIATDILIDAVILKPKCDWRETLTRREVGVVATGAGKAEAISAGINIKVSNLNQIVIVLEDVQHAKTSLQCLECYFILLVAVDLIGKVKH